MKHLILILFLFLTFTIYVKAQYSTPKVWNFRTSSVEGRKPINADFYGKTVYCHNTTDSLIWIRVNNVITQGFTFYPYSDTIVNVHKVIVTSNTRYNAPYYQNSVKTTTGTQVPVKANFTSPNTLIITWGDSTAWQLVRGVVTKTWRIFPYNFDTIAPLPPVYPTLATRIYVSSVSGDDASVNPHNPATPYKSISKINTISTGLNANDSILFMAGEIFTGTLTPGKSNLYIGKYGIGAAPVISGFQTITGWVNEGSGIYSKLISPQTIPNIVSVNGVNTPMGRYPNIGTLNGGYLTYETSSGSTSITDNQLTGSPNWIGAEVVVRKNAWIINRCPITNHVSGTLTFTDPSGYNSYNGWGYFIQNDIRTLDVIGEWFCGSGKIYMYFGATNPNAYTVKVSVTDKNVYLNTRNYITFDSISFEGANVYALHINASSNATIKNCSVNFVGKDAIYNPSSSYLNVNNCSISNVNDNAVYGNSSSTYTYVGHSTITKCGMIAGNSGYGDGHNFGVSLQGNNGTMEYCTVTNMGYLGMIIAGNNMLVKNNVFDSTCLIKDDGAGIYVSGALTTVMSNRIIRNNIVSNSLGNLNGKAAGSIAQANGIYVDGTGNNVLIDSNTVFNCTFNGIYLGFYTHHITAISNTLINNKYQLNITENDYVNNNFTINDNIFASTGNNELLRRESSAPTTDRPISSLGTWNGNYYIKPFGSGQVYWERKRVNSTRTEYLGLTKEGWATYDTSMKLSPVTIVPYVVNSYITSNQYPNGTFNSNTVGVRGFYWSGGYSLTWDNTNQITNGTAKIALTTLGVNANVVDFAIPVNLVEVGKKYLVKFDIKSPVANRAVGVHLRSWTTPYPYLMDNYDYYPMATVNNTTKTVEVLLEPLVSATADVRIQFTDADLPMYIDNFEFREVNITKAVVNDHMLFEYATTSPRSVVLSGTWKTLDNVSKSGTITIQPYKSILLLR